MEISVLQIVLLFLVACISGMGSILDEWQTPPTYCLYNDWLSFR